MISCKTFKPFNKPWASTSHPLGVPSTLGKRGNEVQGTNLAWYSWSKNNRLDARVQNGRRKECKRQTGFTCLDSYLTPNRPWAATAATIPRVGGWDFMKVDRRLLGIGMPGSVIAQTKPGSATSSTCFLRDPFADAVVFAHDVNRTAVLPFQTFNCQKLATICYICTTVLKRPQRRTVLNWTIVIIVLSLFNSSILQNVHMDIISLRHDKTSFCFKYLVQ